MELDLLGGLIGGIGLFLLGMQLMTSGLRNAAGQQLSDILQHWTRTKLRGVLSGAMMTALVQSSSAVTVAILGFVNAGLMNLSQAVMVIYGSNIGTTMTAWLVATIGFHINIKAFALPAIGIGMLLKVSSGDRRRGAFGEALAGFGIFFLGIEVLKSSFGGLGEAIQFSQLSPAGIGLLWLVLSGFAMTLVMQSSSAAMALILTAVGGGVIPLDAAAAMVIGANVGTTSTALLGVIGATPNAKRAAAAHISFNIITGIVALSMLGLLLNFTQALCQTLGLGAQSTVVLALFHTLFNLLGVLLLLPFSDRLVTYLERRFRSEEEDIANPRFLDKTLLNTPTLAIQALTQELGRIGQISRESAMAVISMERAPGPRLSADKRATTKLAITAGEYSSALQRSHLSRDIADALPNAPRISRYYTSAMKLVTRIASDLKSLAPLKDDALAAQVSQFKSLVVKLIERADALAPHYNPDVCAATLESIDTEYQQLKRRLLRAGTGGELSTLEMVAQLELMSEIHRLARQIEKGARYLHEFSHQVPAENIEREVTEEEN